MFLYFRICKVIKSNGVKFIMFNIILIFTGFSVIFCLYLIVVCLIAISVECEMPSIDDIEV